MAGKRILLLLIGVVPFFTYAQQETFPINSYHQEFEYAYQQFPEVPEGLLEAVSFTMTHFKHHQNVHESCVGLPLTYGVMGLTLDGKHYFRNNLNYIARSSHIQTSVIISDPQQNILAYAAAYKNELQLMSPFVTASENVAYVLTQLSELPNHGLQQDYALNAFLYAVLRFLNDEQMQQHYGFPKYDLDLKAVFGENLKVLQAQTVTIHEGAILGNGVDVYKKSNNKSIDYPPAIQDLTTCNFSSRSGTAISAVAIHTIQGSYSGAISWFKNCSANVSAHYVLRSVDGQVTQMVLESDKGWHVGNENPYTIGLEHEGFVNDSSWYTSTMYQSSANLVIDITQSGYGINPLRTAYFPWTSTTNYNVASIPGNCLKIKGHQHYPGQTHTDPGAFWDWDYYYKLINNPTTTPTVNTNLSGTVTDLGGNGNYTNDERTLFLIQPTNAAGITLTVNQFDTEATWDYLYIYAGTTVFSSLIGVYTGTTIPTTINVNGGAALIEFRSDCANTNPGYQISWNTTLVTGVSKVEKGRLRLYPNPVEDEFTIELGLPATGTITIKDIGGRIVLQKELKQEAIISILLGNLAPGVYWVCFNNEVAKLVKK